MRPAVFALFASLSLFAAVPLAAQERPDSSVQDIAAPPVPADLAEVERARSESCVPIFAGMDRLDAALGPLAERAQRIQQLAQAMALEDSTRVTPFDASDSLEAKVQAWFVSDGTLGARYAETGDSAVLARRAEEKQAVRTVLRTTLEHVGEEGKAMVDSAGDLGAATALCQGKILVRGPVLAVCDTVESPVCAAARADTVGGRFRFVDEAETLWDIESLSAWTDPAPLARGPDGNLVGARTSGAVRRGNVQIRVGVGSILRSRADLSSEEVLQFEGNLDTMGFTFQHPDLVMAPALEIAVDIPAPLAGETHYFLHFGDLSSPATQVVWTTRADAGGPVQAKFPAPPGVLARLQAGEAVSLTALRMAQPEEPVDEAGEAVAEAEALYTIPLTPVSQAPAVGTLMNYMGGGAFSQDLNRLVPSTGGS